MHIRLILPLLLVLGTGSGVTGCDHRQEVDHAAFDAWIADPHQRVFPGSFGRDTSAREIRAQGARNDLVIFQLGIKSSQGLDNLHVEVSDLEGQAGKISRDRVRVRYPEFLPVDENGQLTPDPLREAGSIDLQSHTARSVWIDLQVPEDAAAGTYRGSLSLVHRVAALAEFQVILEVVDITLPPVRDDHFYFNILMDLGSIARLHRVERWSEEHWRLIQKYVDNWAAHSQDAVTVFLVEDPWEGDTGFPVAGLLQWELGGRWEELGDPQFRFDYSRFDRFVRMCLDAGINKNIQCWSPVIMPHKDYSVITYRDSQSSETRTVRLEVGSAGYERAWSQFARSFEAHQREQGWLELTTVGLDELSTEVLDKIVPVFQKIAPDLPLMVSGGDEKGKYTQFTPETAFHYGYIQSEVPLPDRARRRAEGKRTLVYTAFSPLYPNTFIFSEPLESRMLPWLVWKHNFDGYIRWAWNFWLDDFLEQPRYKWRSGDMFLTYPGEDGPMDSIRTEMLLKGARDYECLWMIREGLEKLHRQGQRERALQVESQLAEAIELAVQQMDPVRPYRPLSSDLPEARRLLHKILLGLKQGNP